MSGQTLKRKFPGKHHQSIKPICFFVIYLLCQTICACSSDPDLQPVTIIVDGDLEDWRDNALVTLLGEDPQADGLDKDLKPHAMDGQSDLLKIYAAQDGWSLCFYLEFAGALPKDGSASYGLYLDVDGNKKTGYLFAGGAMGADYIVLNGYLMRFNSQDGTEWKWSDSILGVRQAPGPAESHAIELCIDRKAIGLGDKAASLSIAVAGIDTNEPSTWTDDVTDYFPESGGVIGSMAYELGEAETSEPLPPPLKDVSKISNWLVYYGAWDWSIIPKINEFDLVILASNSGPAPAIQAGAVRQIMAGKNKRYGDDDDVIVLGYISMGEDVRSFNNQPPIVEDGLGPAHWDKTQNKLVYQHQGVAGYYLDERKSRDLGDWGQDGKPDRHGTWGACYVDPGHIKWQDVIIGADGRSTTPYSSDALLKFMGYDGMFLDTPEVADPWTGYGYTAKGMYSLIERLDKRYPNKLLLLNRGLFFFMPQYPFQYSWNPRQHIDILLFESHYLDSNYHCSEAKKNCCNESKTECTQASEPDAYNVAPFVPLTKNYSNPKIEANIALSDKMIPVLSLDYAARPDSFAKEYPEMFEEVVDFSIHRYGRIELISDRMVTATPRLIIDYQRPPDLQPPEWDNSTRGFTSMIPETRPFYMVMGYDDNREVTPRVGIQKAIPGDGQVTVLWDVARDESRPVHYNIYYSDHLPVTAANAKVLKNVRFRESKDYTDRSYTSFDDACPFEFIIGNLENNTVYYFVVRAEDSTRGVSKPAAGRSGPSGGIEDPNEMTLAAVPRKAGSQINLSIDGNFSDWKSLPFIQEQNSSWSGFSISDDQGYIYIYLRALNTSVIENFVAYLSVDNKSYTGYIPQGGADYLIQGGELFEYANTPQSQEWTWCSKGLIDVKRQGKEAELRIPKAKLKALGPRLSVRFAVQVANNKVVKMPEAGSAGYTYTLLN